MLGVVNNDKRDTLSFIFQIGLPALEECIKKNKNKRFNWKRVIAVMAKPGSATLQQQGAEVLLEQQFPWRKGSIILGSTQIHHRFHLTGLSSRQGWVETGKGENTPCSSAPPSSLQTKAPPWQDSLHCRKSHTTTSNRFTAQPFAEPAPLAEEPLHTLQPPRLSSLCIFCSFFLGHCRVEKKHN